MAPQVHAEDDLLDKSFQARSVHVYFLGLALILSGPVGDWNRGLESGLWSYFLEFLLLSLAYLALVLCLAEMTSVVAFASGAYGYVRCSVGPFWGYVVAVCELLENSCVSITCAVAVSQALTVATGLSRLYEPLWLCLYYAVSFAVQSRGGATFWTTMVALGALTVLVVVVYCVAVLAAVDLSRLNLADDGRERFVGGGAGFARNFYRPMWMYIGAEAITVSGKNIRHGPSVIPHMLIAALVTAFALNVTTIFATVVAYIADGGYSGDTGDTAGDAAAAQWHALTHDPLPLSVGFRRALQLPLAAGAALTLLPNFASGLGFLYAATHLTQAMALSGLAAPALTPTVGEAKVPLRALAANCVAQCVAALVGWAASGGATPPFYELCVMAACVVYGGVFAAFVAFRVRFSNMARQFRSPLGLCGAAYGLLLFGATLVEVAVDTADRFVVVVFAAALLAAAAYYVAVAEARQFFSPEEQTRFMKAYIMNANKRRKSLAAGDRSPLATLATWLVPRRRSAASLSPSGRSDKPPPPAALTGGSGGSGGSSKATLLAATAAAAAPALRYTATPTDAGDAAASGDDDVDGGGGGGGGALAIGGGCDEEAARGGVAPAAATSLTVHATYDGPVGPVGGSGHSVAADVEFATESALDTLPL